VLTLDELVAAFSLERVTPSAAVFDPKKLEWVNGEWIRRLDLDELIARVEPYAEARYGDDLDRDVLRRLTAIGQERATTLVALVDQMDFATRRPFAVADDVWSDVLAKTERPDDVLDAAIAHIERCDWDPESIGAVRDAIAAVDLKPGKVMKVLYAAIEGRGAGLPLFDCVHLLGRDVALERLRSARARI
jgi:glutamyl-tRNA synthetase